MKALRWRTSIAFHLEVVQLHNRSDAQYPLQRSCPDSKHGLNLGYPCKNVAPRCDGLISGCHSQIGHRLRMNIWMFVNVSSELPTYIMRLYSFYSQKTRGIQNGESFLHTF